MSKKIVLTNLNPDEIVHPQERSALINLLNKIPMASSLLSSVSELYGKWIAVDYYGNGVVATNGNMPSLCRHLESACEIIGLKEIPELATEWSYRISSYTVGGDKIRVVLSSGAVDLLSEDGLYFMLGQELGHIVTGHLPYHMLLELLYSNALEIDVLASVAAIIRLPMLDWYRKSHYTADRVALLCCQDIDVALCTMMKMAGLPKKYFETTDPKAFILQAREFAGLSSDGVVSKLMTKFLLRSAAMPWMVDRAKVLMDWYESGEYHDIINRG